MRNLLVTFVAVLAMMLLTSPAQADQTSAEPQDVTLTSSCSNCETTANITTAPAFPQGETGEIQPIGDHTWGGDPDENPAYEGWVSWWWFVMNVLYYYSCDGR